MDTPGDSLEHLLRNTRSKLLIVSPFIKVNALKRLLGIVSDDVKVTCVTRWRLDEIIAGVSDLEIWDLLRAQSNAALLLRMNLHAKYYRGDDNCLIGSANITNTALGWSVAPNLELLIPSTENKDFENQLFAGTVDVTEALYYQYKLAVDNYPKTSYPINPSIQPDILEYGTQTSNPTGQFLAIHPVPLETWMPKTRFPESVYSAYIGQEEYISTATKESVTADLAVLSIPDGLNEKTFNLFVATALVQMPIISQVDRFVEKPQRFGAVRDLIMHITGFGKTDANTAWQTLMRWLLYYLPDKYERKQPHFSEIFGKKEKAI